MRLKARLRGAREQERRLARLERIASEPVQERALFAGAEIIAEDARARVHRRSGGLAVSIKVSREQAHYGPSASSGTVGLAGGGLSHGGVTVYIGPAAPDGFYGHMEEFGTIDTPAHPFMRPAIDAKRGAAFRAMANVIRAEFQKEGAR